MAEEKQVLPSMRLDGRVALVTGAGRGIGRASALALAEAGAEVIAMSRTEDEVASVAAAIRESGGSARAVVCDVTDTATLIREFEALERLDVLLNNAGVSIPAPLLEIEEDKLDVMLRVNIRAVVLAAKAAARIMVRQGEGVIINLSSPRQLSKGRSGNVTVTTAPPSGRLSTEISPL